MRSRVEGIAFLGLRGGAPRTLDQNSIGRPCPGKESCATGPVHALSYAKSAERGAAAIYQVRPTETAAALAERVHGERLQYQPIRGLLVVRQMQISPLAADEAGQGEPPWDTLATLEEEVAIELRPHFTEIRELRLRASALNRLEIGAPVTYEPANHIEEILAAARKIG